MTIFGILGCTALLITGFGMKDSLNGIIDNQYKKIIHYDIIGVYNPDASQKEKDDYDKVREDDKISILGLTEFKPDKNLKVVLHHADGSKDSFEAAHSYNEQQIGWFKAGSALNGMQ